MTLSQNTKTISKTMTFYSFYQKDKLALTSKSKSQTDSLLNNTSKNLVLSCLRIEIKSLSLMSTKMSFSQENLYRSFLDQ